MKNNVYVLGDIAGQYDALMRLVAKLEDGAKIILVGDIVDRGPKSKQVVTWAMNNPNVETILGNHEHLMVDFFRETNKYREGVWINNGGQETLVSYFGDRAKFYEQHEVSQGMLFDWTTCLNPKELIAEFPIAVVEWMEGLPLKKEIEVDGKKFFISHAPLAAHLSPDEAEKAAHDPNPGTHQSPATASLLWNRYKPIARGDVGTQVFGHNSNWKLKFFGIAFNPWAICLDDSSNKVLTALHLNTLNVIQEPYKEKI